MCSVLVCASQSLWHLIVMCLEFVYLSLCIKPVGRHVFALGIARFTILKIFISPLGGAYNVERAL